jgi:TM2 domain-containing membrane protein YozV
VQVWLPPALSALLPGLGQFCNAEILRGSIFLFGFAGMALPLGSMLLALRFRSMEVQPAVLTVCAASAFLIWCWSVGDAYVTARKGPTGQWGLT